MKRPTTARFAVEGPRWANLNGPRGNHHAHQALMNAWKALALAAIHEANLQPEDAPVAITPSIRLITIAIPRIRDFRGLNTRSFDGRGNYSMGVKEQMIFPEINYDQIDQIRGMDITFVTSAPRDDHAFALLRELGMPFRGEERPRGLTA